MSLPPNADLSKIPAMKPPAGVTPNFIDPHSMGDTIIIVNVVFLGLMLGFVALRIYTKGFLSRSVGWDDYTCVLAAIGSVVHTVLVVYQTQHGYGTHQWDLPLSVLTSANIQTLHALTIVAYPTTFFVKLSILLLYLRIFGIDRKFRSIIYSVIAVQALAYLAGTAVAVALMVLCTLEHARTRPFCTQNYKHVIFQSVFGVITDFLVLGIPIARVWSLKLSTRRKVGVLGIFMTGLIACIASLASAIYVIQKLHSPDQLYAAGKASIYGSVETNLGIISGAMTSLPMFYQKSHLRELGHSTWMSLRSRISYKSRVSQLGSSSKAPSESSGGFREISSDNKKGPHDSNDILIPSSSENRMHNLDPCSHDDGFDNSRSKYAGIVKTDEYMVISEKAHPDPKEV